MNYLVNLTLAALIAGGAYLFDAPLEKSIFLGVTSFLFFSFNQARAEVEELKLILDDETPGWRERNAMWTSTWDWNRRLKRRKER